ncbi:MAG TPA: hypothetical protein VFJ10_04160, partial [Acidobacteriaceae bacterium]|nr:hypothetical protein [Acidobacteriaceae bacterium]
MAGRNVSGRVDRFWRRVTDGMQLSQLWDQFRADARTSYRLYSKEVDATPQPGRSGLGRGIHLAVQFFWAVVEKLTPARRILLLVALVLLFLGIQGSWAGAN